ncbi:cation transporter [Iodidimonas gelatinilytica]|nr:Na+/H+ antiporter subunit E [Iodidimonas gelatinilytica]GEQ96364.1 cation transporter [Iodidimonas gelatinilytica]
MLRSLMLFIALCGTWLLWSGIFEPLLLSLGLASCVFTILLARHLGIVNKNTVPLQLGLSIVTYWLWLLVEIVKSNIAVIKVILSPKLSLNPGFVRLENMSHTDMGRVIFANSITLTPGTVTCDLGDETIFVHCLDKPGAVDGIQDMNRRTAGFKGED